MNQLIYILNLTYGHEFWVLTKRMTPQIQADRTPWRDCVSHLAREHLQILQETPDSVTGGKEGLENPATTTTRTWKIMDGYKN